MRRRCRVLPYYHICRRSGWIFLLTILRPNFASSKRYPTSLGGLVLGEICLVLRRNLTQWPPHFALGLEQHKDQSSVGLKLYHGIISGGVLCMHSIHSQEAYSYLPFLSQRICMIAYVIPSIFFIFILVMNHIDNFHPTPK